MTDLGPDADAYAHRDQSDLRIALTAFDILKAINGDWSHVGASRTYLRSIEVRNLLTQSGANEIRTHRKIFALNLDLCRLSWFNISPK
jgi:hypothetical protein